MSQRRQPNPFVENEAQCADSGLESIASEEDHSGPEELLPASYSRHSRADSIDGGSEDEAPIDNGDERRVPRVVEPCWRDEKVDPAPLDPTKWIGDTVRGCGLVIGQHNVTVNLNAWVKWCSSHDRFEIIKDELYRSYRWCKDVWDSQGNREMPQTAEIMAKWMGVKDHVAENPYRQEEFLRAMRERLRVCTQDLQCVHNQMSRYINHLGSRSQSASDGKRRKRRRGRDALPDPEAPDEELVAESVEQEIQTLCVAIGEQINNFVTMFGADVRLTQVNDLNQLGNVRSNVLADQKMTHIDGVMVATEACTAGEKMKPTTTKRRVREYMENWIKIEDVLLDIHGDVITKGEITRGILPGGECMCISDGRRAPDYLTAFLRLRTGSCNLYNPYPTKIDKKDPYNIQDEYVCSLPNYCRHKINKDDYPTIHGLVQELPASKPIAGITEFLVDTGVFNNRRVRRNLNLYQFKNGYLVYHARRADRTMRNRSVIEGRGCLGFTFVEHGDIEGFQRLYKRKILSPKDVPHRSFPFWFDRSILAMGVSDIYTPNLDSILTHQGYCKDHRITNNILALLGLQMGPPRKGRNCTTVLFGPGGTGKSMLTSLIGYIIPKYMKATLQLGMSGQAQFRWTSLISNLHDVTHHGAPPIVVSNVIITEVPETITADDSTLKMAFEGAGEQEINIKFQNPQQVEMCFNTLMATNFKICAKKNDGNTFGRRMVYILMPKKAWSPEFGGMANRDDALQDKLMENVGALIVTLGFRSAELLREMGKSGFIKKYLDPHLNAFTESIVRKESSVCCAIMAGVQCQYFGQWNGHENDVKISMPDGKEGEGAVASAGASAQSPVAQAPDEIEGPLAREIKNASNCWIPWTIFHEFLTAYVKLSAVKKGRLARCAKVPDLESARKQIEDFWNLSTTPIEIKIDEKATTFQFLNQTYTDYKVKGLGPGSLMTRRPARDLNVGAAEPEMEDPFDAGVEEGGYPDEEEEPLSVEDIVRKTMKSSLVDPSGAPFGTRPEDIKHRDTALAFINRNKLTDKTSLDKAFVKADCDFYKTNKRHMHPAYLKKMIHLFDKLACEFATLHTCGDEEASDDDQIFGHGSRDDMKDDLQESGTTLQHPLVVAVHGQLARLKSGKPNWRQRGIDEDVNEEMHTNRERLHSSYKLICDKIKSDVRGVSYKALMRSRIVVNTLAVARFGLLQMDALIQNCHALDKLSNDRQKREFRAFAHWGFLLKFLFGYQVTGIVDPSKVGGIAEALCSQAVIQWCTRLLRWEKDVFTIIHRMIEHMAVGHLQSTTTYCMVGGARELFLPIFNGIHATASALLCSDATLNRKEPSGVPLLAGLSPRTVASTHGKAWTRQDRSAPEIALRPLRSSLGVLAALLYDSSLNKIESQSPFRGFQSVLKYCRRVLQLHPKRGAISPQAIHMSAPVLSAIKTLMSALQSNAAACRFRNRPNKKLLQSQFLKDPTLKMISGDVSRVARAESSVSAQQALADQAMFLNPYCFDVGGIIRNFSTLRIRKSSSLLSACILDGSTHIFWTKKAVLAECETVAHIKNRARVATVSSAGLLVSQDAKYRASSSSDPLAIDITDGPLNQIAPAQSSAAASQKRARPDNLGSSHSARPHKKGRN